MNYNSLYRNEALFSRDRDMDDQRHRAIQQQAEEMAHREREQGDRQHREPYPPSAPHHNSAGSIPIHQPVASRISGAIHSPGGLLANHGSSAAPPLPLGAPSGPVAAFGGPLHAESNRPHPSQTNSSQHQMFAAIPHNSIPPNNSAGGPPPGPFGGPLQENQRPPQSGPYGSAGGSGAPGGGSGGAGGMPGPHPMPGGPVGVAHGQQPILNVSGNLLTYIYFTRKSFPVCPENED
jgi:paired amphipathic helix protein Sin3a